MSFCQYYAWVVPYRSYVSEGLGGGFVRFPTEKTRKGTGMIES